MNTAIKLDRQSMFEAVEIDNPVFDAALAAKLRAQPSAVQQIPCRFFSFGLVAPQFAEALGWDAHGESITALRRLSRAQQLCLATEETPHPSGDGWRKRRRRTPSPQGRGLYFRLGHPRCPAKDVGHAQPLGRGWTHFAMRSVSDIADSGLRLSSLRMTDNGVILYEWRTLRIRGEQSRPGMDPFG